MTDESGRNELLFVGRPAGQPTRLSDEHNGLSNLCRRGRGRQTRSRRRDEKRRGGQGGEREEEEEAEALETKAGECEPRRGGGGEPNSTMVQ